MQPTAALVIVNAEQPDVFSMLLKAAIYRKA
jgi:hypothetical protein